MGSIALRSKSDFYRNVPRHVTFAALQARCRDIPKDQEDVSRRMECYRLGIKHDADPNRWRYLLRRLIGRRWHVLDYDEYRAKGFDPWRYGGPVPHEWEQRVQRVRATFPEIDMKVYATKNDPWLVGILDGHKFIIGGWYLSALAETHIL